MNTFNCLCCRQQIWIGIVVFVSGVLRSTIPCLQVSRSQYRSCNSKSERATIVIWFLPRSRRHFERFWLVVCSPSSLASFFTIVDACWIGLVFRTVISNPIPNPLIDVATHIIEFKTIGVLLSDNVWNILRRPQTSAAQSVSYQATSEALLLPAYLKS